MFSVFSISQNLSPLSGVFSRWSLLLCLLILYQNMIAQTCPGDNTLPTAICAEAKQVLLDASGNATLNAVDLDGGSSDNNSIKRFEVSRPSGTACGGGNQFGATARFCCADAFQSVTVTLKVVDCNENAKECSAVVKVLDQIAPVCQPPADITVFCDAFDPTLENYGVPTVTDNCCVGATNATPNYANFDTTCYRGIITQNFVVSDCHGNTSACSRKIEVVYKQDYYVRFPDDLILSDMPEDISLVGNNFFNGNVFYGNDCELMSATFTDRRVEAPAGVCIKIERTWTLKNWCTYNPALPLISIPNPNPNATALHVSNLPGPVVSESGNNIPTWTSTVAKINNTDPVPTDFSTFYNKQANGYQYVQNIWVNSNACMIIRGNVFSDVSKNCTLDANEPFLPEWSVKATGIPSGKTYHSIADALGEYVIVLDSADTLAEISANTTLNTGCPPAKVVLANGQPTLHDIPVQLESTCSLLSVDMATPFLRRCFPNTYHIYARNLSNTAVNNVQVEVTLDSFFNYQSASIPGVSLGNRTWAYPLGTLAAGESRSFNITFLLSCDAALGQTHCSQAQIFPKDPGCENALGWSGADLKATATCQGNAVNLSIKNVGAGDMTEMKDFVVVEDVIMFQKGKIQLKSGETKSLTLPANGSTWGIQTFQEKNHPWNGMIAAAVEGCGGLNSTGLVTSFPLNSADPFETVDCRQNRGSFDPNDKQAFPAGMGEHHLLEPGTDIEYLIRFQNTGTDTAFSIVIVDILPGQLRAATVRPGASSHPYSFSMTGDVLKFRFDQIALPDNKTNEPQSHGFVKFRVAQRPDIAIGTTIENKAQIYFDFNDPIETNTTFHTIGRVVSTATVSPSANALPVRISPNPAKDAISFHWSNAISGQFVLTDALGHRMLESVVTGNHFKLERKHLPAGVYYYQIISATATLSAGKVIFE